jgi:probable nitrogen fixation protein
MSIVQIPNQLDSAIFIDNSSFLKAIVQQIRAGDVYGTYRSWSDELLLRPYILSKKERRDISVDSSIEPATMSRIITFYRAIAGRIEQETGRLSQVVIDLNQEGFGWVLIFSGRLILVSRTLRDAQRFSFTSFEKLAGEGEKLIQKGIDLAQQYPDVCSL